MAPYVRSILFTIPGSSGGPGTQVYIFEEAGNLNFTVDLLNTSSVTGDLRGLFFHINESKLPGLAVTKRDSVITQAQIGRNNIINLGNGANLSGAVSTGFDVGIEFGEEGIGQGKLDVNAPVKFTLDATQDLTLDDVAQVLFGSRITSVGAPNGARTNSSKDIFRAPAAPDAKNDAYTIFEDGASGLTSPSKTPVATRFSVLANDTDADGDALVITSIGDAPDYGTVTIAPDGKSVFYTPNLDYAGPDSFIYSISDGKGGTDFATVNLTVTAVADAPTLTYTILPGSSVNQVIVRATATQTDADSSEFIDRITLSGIPANVTVNTNGINPVTEDDQITQDFVLTLPLNTDTSFSLGMTAFSKEVSNGDEESKSVSVPITLDYNTNAYTSKFLATDQSIWDSGNQFTFVDDRFIGFETSFDKSSNDAIGYVLNGNIKAGFQSTLTFEAGEIDASLDYNLGINTNYNKTTDQLLISSSRTLTGGDFITEGPEGSYKLDFIFNYLFNAALTYNVFGLSGDIFRFSDKYEKTYNILDVNSNSLQTEIPLPAPFGSVSASLAWPNITTDGAPSSPPPGEFSSSGASNNFFQLNVDVDQALADIFLGGKNPFDLSAEINIADVIKAWGRLEVLDLDVFAGLNFLQDFIMQEQPFAATLNFENGTNRAFTFGDDILLPGASTIDAGGDKDGLVEFTLNLDAQASLNNKTKLGFNIGYSFNLLTISAGYDVPLLGSDSVTIGPVFTAGATQPLGSVDIYKNTFALNFAAQDIGFAA